MIASPERWRFILVSGVLAMSDAMEETRFAHEGNGDVKQKPRIRGAVLPDSVRRQSLPSRGFYYTSIRRIGRKARLSKQWKNRRADNNCLSN